MINPQGLLKLFQKMQRLPELSNLGRPMERSGFSAVTINTAAQTTTSYALRMKKAKKADKRRLVRTSVLAVQIVAGGALGLAATCFILFLVYPQHPIICFLQQSLHHEALPKPPANGQPQRVPPQEPPSVLRPRAENPKSRGRSSSPVEPSIPPVTPNATPNDAEVAPRSSTSAPAMRPSDFDNFTLPSGKRLSPTVWDIPTAWHTDCFPLDATNFYVHLHPNGRVRGVYSFDEANGKLDGWSAALKENGKLWILVNYHQADRDGLLRVWEDSGNIHLYAEYTRGNLDGLACLFRNGVPRLVEEWDAGRHTKEYLVVLRQQKPAAVLLRDLGEEEAKEAAEAQRMLSTVWTQMEDGERELKKGLWEWFRAELGRSRREQIAGRAGAELPSSKEKNEPKVNWRLALEGAHPRNR